jgi:putative membrane protein
MSGNVYLWVKAFHVIAVMAWMAGMLYLPRLYVYHVKAKPGGELDETLKVMERRLLRAIINPAMIVSVLLGGYLIYLTGAGMPGSGGWFHAKALLLVGMFASHGVLARHRKAFANGKNTKSERYFRILNEVPTVLMVGIVILAVLKPF